MNRRYPAVALALVAVGATIAAARQASPSETATFSIAAQGWMPSTSATDGLTETWFCPGVPVTGAEGAGGEIVIANRHDEPLVGNVLVLSDDTGSTRLDLAVDDWASAVVDLDATLPGDVVGAVVEIEGGGALVEQHAFHPSGDSVTPCANATSDQWFLADGFTVDGSLDQIVLTNPFEQTVVVNLEFATREGARRPTSYRGLTVAPESIRVVDLGAPGAGAQSEPILAVKVEATRGRLVVGRSQWFLGGGRLGTQVTLGSPAAREQWWFADGAKGPGTSERFSLYNPSDEDVEVDVLFIGIQTPVVVDPISVPAGEVVTFDPGDLVDLPDGRHATVFATSNGEPAIVVERAVTRAVDDTLATSVLAGATPRQDGHVATTWYLAAAPDEPAEDALVVFNADNSPGEVSVSVFGSSGPVPVAGLQAMPLPAASILTIDLTDPLVLGRELVVDSTTRVFVERAVPNGRNTHRTWAWAVPAG